MTSEGFVFHRHLFLLFVPIFRLNDSRNSLPKEDPTCTSSTLNELPMIWNANGISSGYGLVMSPGTYPPPSICQPNLFDQASTRSFPICYGEIAETIQDERSAFQNPYVAAQSVRCVVGPDLFSSKDAQRLPKPISR
ncbi:hypothetical protein ARMSODRAFT_966517 [Armillaria solidipes]|uniref:Uncharacterized protein n=1 Tax=Armillaria solidipes TaxID=1076256 RepID=A0A2H3BA18_9AGAR|nr:hypothetical protein ARMSODRAFT_966517 [Armillaria solidipes]